jgi:Ca2+-binding EF-hand superfamily protein
LADENHDGVITKDEMTHWLAYYMSHKENTRHVEAEEKKAPAEE